MMKERAINLKTHEVETILSGKKTQLRRVMKNQPIWLDGDNPMVSSGWSYEDQKGKFSLKSYPDHFSFTQDFLEHAVCPIGKIGQRLYVRESWGMAFSHEVPDGHPKKMAGTWGVPAYPHYKPCVVYKADGEFTQTGYWKNHFLSPLMMNKEYSRLVLEITNIRIERLNDISQADSVAEGGAKSHPSIDKVSRQYGYADWSRSHFAQTWDWHNTVKWSENPWVWVVEFKLVENGAVQEDGP